MPRPLLCGGFFCIEVDLGYNPELAQCGGDSEGVAPLWIYPNSNVGYAAPLKRRVKIGQYRLNTEVFCDHATPEKETAFRMHMDLPFPREDFSKLHEMLNKNRWNDFSDYFTQRYPEHKKLIEAWCSGSSKRSCTSQDFHRANEQGALAT